MQIYQPAPPASVQLRVFGTNSSGGANLQQTWTVNGCGAAAFSSCFCGLSSGSWAVGQFSSLSSSLQIAQAWCNNGAVYLTIFASGGQTLWASGSIPVSLCMRMLCVSALYQVVCARALVAAGYGSALEIICRQRKRR